MRRRRLVLISMIVLAAPLVVNAQSPKSPQPDPVVGVDKVKHFFVAGFVETMTFAGIEALGGTRASSKRGAIAVTAVVSLGREIHDRKTKGFFSVRDLAWDFLGAAAAMLVINKTQ